MKASQSMTTLGLLTALSLGVASNTDAAIITGVTATSQTELTVQPRPISSMVDGTGLDAFGVHTTNASGTQWASDFDSVDPDATPNPVTETVTFDLGGNFDLENILYWNFSGNPIFGVKDLEILTTTSVGGTQTSLGDFVFAQALPSGLSQSVSVAGLTGSTNVREVLFVIKSEHGGTNDLAGLAEVQFEAVPEPGSLALLGLGGLLVARRRRG
ncbi:MAG: PEP-CTERM sorting domain-containing protein [Planctomycetota bacterium]